LKDKKVYQANLPNSLLVHKLHIPLSSVLRVSAASLMDIKNSRTKQVRIFEKAQQIKESIIQLQQHIKFYLRNGCQKRHQILTAIMQNKGRED
jgi:hypothetical protein